ncbi:MAG: hypothetical protein ACK5W7_00950 [Gemmatimonadaceae bacterium]|nr:hypothetical protein [Gemmatimonadota bacterium]
MRRSWRVGVLLPMAVVVGCRSGPLARASVHPLPPRIPRDAARFEIDSVTDSTASFRVQEARWIRPGHAAYVVDAKQRDALVARLHIVGRDSLTATALITSQVARVRAEHVLLVVRPPSPWWRSNRFWVGSLAGAAVGAGGALLGR